MEKAFVNPSQGIEPPTTKLIKPANPTSRAVTTMDDVLSIVSYSQVGEQ